MPGPGDIACAGGAVWVADAHWPRVTRIDPGQARVVATLDILMDVVMGPPRVAATPGALWMAGYNAVARIDPATDRVVAVIPIFFQGTIGGYTVDDIAADDDGVWVAGLGQKAVQRIDGATNRVGAVHPVPPGLRGVVSVAGSLWMVDHDAGEAVRIEAAHGVVLRRISLGGQPTTNLWADGGYVWVEVVRHRRDLGGRVVVQIDASSEEIVGVAASGGTEAPWRGDGWASHGAVWSQVGRRWADGGRGAASLLRIDPASGEVVRSIHLPLLSITALAKDASGLWMAGMGTEGRGALAVRIDVSPGADDIVVQLPGASYDRLWPEDQGSGSVDGSPVIFVCSLCGVDISRPVRRLRAAPPIPEMTTDDRIEDWVPPGTYLNASGPSPGQQPVVKPVLNVCDLADALPHSDRWRRTDGCCGTGGGHGPNLMCRNGHEIGVEANDCTAVNGVWLLPEVVTERVPSESGR